MHSQDHLRVPRSQDSRGSEGAGEGQAEHRDLHGKLVVMVFREENVWILKLRVQLWQRLSPCFRTKWAQKVVVSP